MNTRRPVVALYVDGGSMGGGDPLVLRDTAERREIWIFEDKATQRRLAEVAGDRLMPRLEPLPGRRVDSSGRVYPPTTNTE
jgi:hypothetical protein